MPLASVAFDFDPFVRFGGSVIRLETLGVALALLTALLVAARIAARTPVESDPGPFVHGDRLRLDDLVFVVLAIIPGAVAGGRVGYVLIHLDYYTALPRAILDPAQGNLELGLAVAGGALTGAYAARLLGEPAGRWFHVAALPTLLGLTLGKLAMALGGDGQGAPTDVAWATSYNGPGPWGTLGPAIPSHPAQLYEAAATTVVLVALIGLLSAGAFQRRDGEAFLVALAGWAVVRVLVATTWRDAEILGPLRADQLLSIGILGACLAGAVVLRTGRRPQAPEEPVRWPDPADRPPF